MDQTGGDDPSAADDLGDAFDGFDDLDGLAAWAAEVRVDDAIDQRRRAAWLRRQAAEGATLAGVLVDLAEQGRAVTVQTSVGQRHRGRITIVGRDVVGLRSIDGQVILLRLDAVVTLRPQPGALPVTGDEPLDATTTLHRLLGRLHQGRDRVVMTMRGGEALAGALVNVGHDVLSVTTDAGGQVYVPLDSVIEVSVVEVWVPESG